jgi:predicted transposase/invertase (TIGR01784 family)
MKYKDSVFSSLFGDPETLRELYGALEGVPLDAGIPITINTLTDVLYMDQYNDISFTIGNKLVILIEHQSTINPNIPLRLLLYIARVYEKIIDQGKKGNLYREKLIRIPRPEFIVLYNGPKPYPDKKILRLSDAFEEIEGFKAEIPPELDLQVTVYNINEGHNEAILERSEKLKGYSTFMQKIRENKETMPLEAAMKAAIEYCIEHSILSKFLLEHAPEVMNMLLSEWNWDDAKEVWQEEAREEGIGIGREEGIGIGREEGREDKAAEIAKNLIGKGLSLDAISETTGLDLETIKNMAPGGN